MRQSWWRNLFPRKLIEWREPKEFRRLVRLSQERTRSRWFRLKWAALIFALLFAPYLGRWLIAEEPRALPPWTALVVAAGAAWFVVYLLLPGLERLPTTVTLWEPYVSRAQGNSHRVWRYAQIVRCSWIHRHDFSVLVVETRPARPGQPDLIGVPAGELVARVDALLRERGVAPQVDETGSLHHFPPTSSE